MTVTLGDVARRAGVSVKTVSNVVNKRPGVGEQTRRRIETVIAELGYRPNPSARALRLGRQGTIGLLVPDLTMPHFSELADSVVTVATRHDFAVMVEQTNRRWDRELAVMSAARLQYVDGLLIAPAALAGSDLPGAGLARPLVLLGEGQQKGPHVRIDTRVASRAATASLISSGRRRIAAVGAGSEQSDEESANRLAGYRDALREAGIRPDVAWIVRTRGSSHIYGWSAMRELLERDKRIDAVFAFHDTLALGAARALQDVGRRVPDDVAVMGFDNIDEGRYAYPSLSTVDPNRVRTVTTAIGLLQDMIGHEQESCEDRDVVIAHQVVVRESSERSAAVQGVDKR